ncbi:MAG: caspase family protein [Pseudomonadota bacterium]
MANRRQFLQTLAAIPPSLLVSPSWSATATADPSRLALIFGNSAYRDAPLTNPGNDARAMSSLLNQAGFTVDSHLDATRTGMIAAIEKFGAAIQRPETKQVVFYYAGHGVQLDWRNYLLPVDAVVEKADQLKQRCVDLGLLLGQLGKAKDKTFIIILDACRNNPFGRVYKPQRRGLSQFDAPVGSLLAYATSPGNVASDGTGKNGLYTENLIRELSQRNTRIEDALKRVRLNVRLSSYGEQIPWETTSLESDVFLFSDGQKKLTDEEIEKQLQADLDAWANVKNSRNIDDWVAYLRNFPNGRFAEIGQVRLSRLLREREKVLAASAEAEKAAAAAATIPGTATSTVATPAPTPATPVASTQEMIELGEGKAIPEIFRPSQNPYSAGFYPLGRFFSIGDKAVFQVSDVFSGALQRSFTQLVTRVDVAADRVEYNMGGHITDLMGNILKSFKIEYAVPVQFYPAEIQVGKKWAAAFGETFNNKESYANYDLQIVRKERVVVPAGEFDAFRVEGEGWNRTYGTRLLTIYWIVPGLNFPIKREFTTKLSNGKFQNADRFELVSLRQKRTSFDLNRS